MTPEEALRHEWIQQAQKVCDLRHSQSEASVSHDSCLSSNTSSSSGSNYPRLHHVKYSTPKISDKVKAKIVTTIDTNLNDSGTFLPPIL